MANKHIWGAPSPHRLPDGRIYQHVEGNWEDVTDVNPDDDAISEIPLWEGPTPWLGPPPGPRPERGR